MYVCMYVWMYVSMYGACSDGRVVQGTATDCTLSLTNAWVRIPA